MPITRSTAGRKATEESVTKQVRDDLLTMDHVSLVGSGSRKKCCSKSSISDRKAKAALKLAELKQKQIEIDNELRLTAAKNEVEMAKLQLTLAEESDKELEPSDGEDEKKNLERYLEDCRAHADHKNIEACPVIPQRAVKSKMELPKIEIGFFDGDAANYWMFVKQFDLYMENQIEDPGERLLCLMYYCKGKAKEAIKGCLMLPPGESYVRARVILRERFGQPHNIARALIDGVVDGMRPPLSSAEMLDELATKMQNCEITLTQMSCHADLNSLATLERIVRRLPLHLQEHWAVRADVITQLRREPDFKDLTAFIVERARLAGSRFGLVAKDSEQRQYKTHRPQLNGKGFEKSTTNTFGAYLINAENENQSVKCVVCNEMHDLESCSDFAKMNVAARWELLKRTGRCFKCMGAMHNASGCRRTQVCGKDGCRGRHHKMLHADKINGEVSRAHKSGSCSATAATTGLVYMGTIPIRVKGPLGEIEAVAFLDNGSDITLVRSDILTRLGIDSQPSSLTINTVISSSMILSQKCKLELSSVNGDAIVRVDEAYAVKSLPIRVFTCEKDRTVTLWPHLRDIPFRDSQSSQVAVLIGCNVPEAHWVMEQRIGDRTQPYATRTALGWTLHGPTHMRSQASVNHIGDETDPTVRALQRLYDLEFADLHDDQKCLSVEERAAVKLITEGTTLSDGNYVVPLPWRLPDSALSDNYNMAVKRLEYLRKRLSRDRDLHQKYKDVIERHIQKGYAVKIVEPGNLSTKRRIWYLPHHVVINPKKPGKVRVVFDCAAKSNGRSLNDYLHSGPDMTSNLCGILMRFRLEAIAVAADIEEMFLQVKVSEEDQDALRFLWWPEGDLNAQPSQYKFKRHPFGATSSPFCANYALRRAVERLETERGMKPGEIASNWFYVDDFITSFADTNTAADISHRLTSELGLAGFKLRKWISNDQKAIEYLSKSDGAEKLMVITDGKPPCERALGIQWDIENDKLFFEFECRHDCHSRREILSHVSTLFDPLGLVAPLLLPAKVLLQKLCKIGLRWDDPISEEHLREWQRWIESMKRVHSLEIDRCIKKNVGKLLKSQLHIFCDASEIGYGAVAYARYETENSIVCSLLYGKARVAPLKTVTIPRLELSAAVLGIRLLQTINNNLKDAFTEVYFWTDSMIVMYYIRNVKQRFSTFVANRLSTIREYSEPAQWHHVNTSENPADKASRGGFLPDKTMDLWFNGPGFLGLSQDRWPAQPACIEQSSLVELKADKNGAAVMCIRNGCPSLFTHYSDWFKLVKAVSWILRYKDYLLMMTGVRRNKSLLTGCLRVKELNNAEAKVIETVQKEAFSRELELLIKSDHGDDEAYRSLVRRGPLRKLCPVLIEGVIRVGGRIRRPNYDVDLNHPVILPGSHPVTNLIVRHYHDAEGHCGPAQLLAAVRRRFWVVQGKLIIKRVIDQCAECRRRNASAGRQMMATLPEARVTAGWRAFNIVGVDYFGPLFVKRGRSMEKRYGCIFTCLQMRAIHIEVAHDLSTDSFLMALMRFIGRRGAPAEIYSDNGSCFVGAESELKQGLAKISQERINNQLLKRGVQWYFNPPLASHRGGVWERMIRSVRRILSTVSKEQTLTEEMLLTFMVEAERILNSRPIVAAHDDHRDALALTPNDLILLHDNNSDIGMNDLQQRYGKCWKRVNYLASLFWTRWTREYLPTLQVRQKWFCKDRNFKTGDVVLVLSEDKQYGKWPLGLVTRCEEDGDGLVRTVIVKTAGRELRRDIRKIALLEGAE